MRINVISRAFSAHTYTIKVYNNTTDTVATMSHTFNTEMSVKDIKKALNTDTITVLNAVLENVNTAVLEMPVDDFIKLASPVTDRRGHVTKDITVYTYAVKVYNETTDTISTVTRSYNREMGKKDIQKTESNTVLSVSLTGTESAVLGMSPDDFKAHATISKRAPSVK